jgi:hypothetical protein
MMPKTPKKQPNKGLSDDELIKKYEAGEFDLGKHLKKLIPPNPKKKKKE